MKRLHTMKTLIVEWLRDYNMLIGSWILETLPRILMYFYVFCYDCTLNIGLWTLQLLRLFWCILLHLDFGMLSFQTETAVKQSWKIKQKHEK